MSEGKRLSNKTILGYGVGAMADAALYNFYVMYALYFMTTVAGMETGKAGAVITLGTVLSALCAIFIGPISDMTKGKFGRRRPYIIAGAFLQFIGLVAFFRTTDLTGGAQFGYYLIMFMIITLSYGVFLVPYNALGAELTNDYDERTKLRTPATIMNCLGNIVGISLPMATVAAFVGMGATEGKAWNYFAIIVAAVCFLSLLITWVTTKGKELPMEQLAAEEAERNPLKTFWQILKMKPFIYIIVILILFGIGYMVFMSGLVYYVLFSAGMTEAQMSTGMFIYVFIGIIWSLVISYMATKLSKQKGMAISMLVSAAAMVILYFVGAYSFPMLIVLLFAYGLGAGAFWLLIYPMVYDLAELYEYKYGKRKEGALMSLYGVIFTLATAIGTPVLTTALTAVGYDPTLTEVSQATADGIATVVLIIPAVMFVLIAVCALVYPMTKDAFEKLMTQLDNKREGKDVDEEGLNRVL